jgi:hypothetical protein
MSNNFYKSVLDTSNETTQALETSALVNLGTTNIKNGCSISYVDNNTTINIVKRGIYYMLVSLTGFMTTTAGLVSAQIYRKGVAMDGAKGSFNSTTTADVNTITIGTLIEVNDVCRCCGTGSASIPITVVNTGVPATHTNVKVVLYKLA